MIVMPNFDLVVFFRALGMLLFLPFGEGAMATVRKSVLSAGLGLLFARSGIAVPLSMVQIPLELITGVILSLPLVLALACASIFGELFDVARGQSVASLYDPLHQMSLPPSALLCRELTWVHLLLLGVLDLQLGLFLESLDKLPTATALLNSWQQVNHSLLLLLSSVCAWGLEIFALWGALFLLLETIGVIALKIIPSVALSSELTLIKSVTGFLLIVLAYQQSAPSELPAVLNRGLSLVVAGL